MTNALADRTRRSRRIVLLGGGVALVCVFVVGAAVEVPAMQRDLVIAVDEALPVDVTVEFYGQDGTLICPTPLEDPAAVQRAAESVEGVRVVALDESCTQPFVVASSTVPATTTPTTSAAPTTAESSTTAATTTTVPSTTAAPPTTLAPADVSVTFQNGHVSMIGRVGSSEQHAALLTAAAAVASPENITDGLDADPAVAISDGEVASMAALVRAMTVPLVSGEIGWRPGGVFARGSYTDDEALSAFQSAAATAGVADTQLVVRHAASAADAAAVEAELNALVATTPIVFEKGEVTVSPLARPILERVAAIAKRDSGFLITVQGHTDSEGDPGRNQLLSEQRAEAVRAELVRLGVPAAEAASVGFGETQLVLGPNGLEDPAKSRRVVFTVTPAV